MNISIWKYRLSKKKKKKRKKKEKREREEIRRGLGGWEGVGHGDDDDDNEPRGARKFGRREGQREWNGLARDLRDETPAPAFVLARAEVFRGVENVFLTFTSSKHNTGRWVFPFRAKEPQGPQGREREEKEELLVSCRGRRREQRRWRRRQHRGRFLAPLAKEEGRGRWWWWHRRLGGGAE